MLEEFVAQLVELSLRARHRHAGARVNGLALDDPPARLTRASSEGPTLVCSRPPR